MCECACERVCECACVMPSSSSVRIFGSDPDSWLEVEGLVDQEFH